MTAGQQLDVTVVGVGGIPADATGVVLNATIDTPSADTFLTVWPSGSPKPNASTINANTGDRIANMVTLKVGAGGKVSVFNFAGNVDVIFDVAEYFVDTINESDLPKVGQVELNAPTFNAINGGPAELAKFTTTVPSDGLLVVTVEGTSWLNLDAPGAAALTDSGRLALCDATATIDPARCGPPLEIWSQDPDGNTDDNSTDPFSITRIIHVSAGDVTMYLNAFENTGGTFGVFTPPVAPVIWMPDTGALTVTS